jgi:hypothetical protein
MAVFLEIELVRLLRHPVTPAVTQRRIVVDHTSFVLQTEVGVDRQIEGIQPSAYNQN